MHLTVASLIFLAQLALGAPSAAAAPRNLRVIGASVLGSGCPSGTAEVKADASNTVFDIRLSDFVAQSGPGVMAADWRKNCKLTLNLEYDQGFQYACLVHFSDSPSPPPLMLTSNAQIRHPRDRHFRLRQNTIWLQGLMFKHN